MSESGIGGTEGLAFFFPKEECGDVAAAGAGEGAGLNGETRREERRGLDGGEEAEGTSVVGGISTVGGGGTGETGTGGSGGVSFGGESDDVED